jgi:hypothetical protein
MAMDDWWSAAPLADPQPAAPEPAFDPIAGAVAPMLSGRRAAPAPAPAATDDWWSAAPLADPPSMAGMTPPMPPPRPQGLDTGMNVPEPPRTVAAQQSQVGTGTGAGARNAVMFPQGSQEPDLPEDWSRLVTPRGVFHYDPSKIRASRIRELSAAGRENEILGLGPVSKPEADKRIQQGEPPVVVTERQPDGTEVKAAVGTPATAQRQARALEQGKLPGSTVNVETPESVITARMPRNPPMPPARPADLGAPPAPEAPQQFGPDQPQMFGPDEPQQFGPESPPMFGPEQPPEFGPEQPGLPNVFRQPGIDRAQAGLDEAEARFRAAAERAQSIAGAPPARRGSPNAVLQGQIEGELASATAAVQKASAELTRAQGRPEFDPPEKRSTILQDLEAGWRQLQASGNTLLMLDADTGMRNSISTISRLEQQRAARVAELKAKGQDPAEDRTLAQIDRRITGIAATSKRQLDQLLSAAGGAMARNNQAGVLPMDSATYGFMESDTFGEAFSRLSKEPERIVPTLLARTAASMLPSVGGTIAGGLMGAPFGPAGVAAGAAAGAFAGSGGTELGASIIEKMMQIAEARKIPTQRFLDARFAASFFDEHRDEIMAYAATRAGIIGGVDAVTGGIAGAVARSGMSLPKKLAAGAGADFVGGPAGEAAAQAATGEWKPGDILAEGVSGVVSGPIEVAGLARDRMRRDPLGDALSGLVPDNPQFAEDEFGRPTQGGAPTEARGVRQAPVPPQGPQAPTEVPEASTPTSEPNIAPTPMSEAAPSPLGTENGAAPTLPDDPDTRTLRAAGYSDEDIADMSPEQRAAEVAAARAEGVEDPGEATGPAPGTRNAPVTVTTEADLEPVRQTVNTEPTPAQIEAGNYQKGHIKFEGLDVSMEGPSGSVRRGTDPDGKAWESKIPPGVDYGYIKGTKASDGDHVDIIIGPRGPTGTVYVVEQNDLRTGKFDEIKVVGGVSDAAEARSTYESMYSDGKGAERIGALVPMSMEDFNAWRDKGATMGKVPKRWRAQEQAQPVNVSSTPEQGSSLPNEPAFVPLAQAKPGDLIEKGRELVERGLSRSAAVKLAKETKGGRIIEDGKRWAVIAPPERAKDRTGRRSTRSKDGKPLTLVAFLRAQGGIKDQSGELRARDLHRRHPGLVNNKKGMELDTAREMAAEAGYIRPSDDVGELSYTEAAVANTTVSDFLDAIDNHPSYSVRDEAEVAANQAQEEATDLTRRIDEVKTDLRAGLLEAGFTEGEIRDRFLTIAAEHVIDGSWIPEHAYDNALFYFYQDDIDGETRPNEQEFESWQIEPIPFDEQDDVVRDATGPFLNDPFERQDADEVRAETTAEAIRNSDRAPELGDQEDDAPGGTRRGDRLDPVSAQEAGENNRNADEVDEGTVIAEKRWPDRSFLTITREPDGGIDVSYEVAGFAGGYLGGGDTIAAALPRALDRLDQIARDRSIPESRKKTVAAMKAWLQEQADAEKPTKTDDPATPVTDEAAEAEAAPQGVKNAELGQIAREFNEAADRGMNGEQITHVFDPPAKNEIVRLDEKVKVYHAENGWMSVEEARAKVEEWKKHAREQGKTGKNSDKVVLSLFDLTGQWVKPWAEAGYQVYQFDIQANPDEDVLKFSTEYFMDNFGMFEGAEVHAILAACPCTDFAVSGAKHFAAKDADGRTIKSVEIVQQTLNTIEFFKPAVWAIENPVGRIEKLTGLPPWRSSWNPNHFGEPYTKRTLLWGRHNADMPIAPVEPTEGSKMWAQYGGKSQATKNARSETPEGFAYAFFMANNAIDHPVQAIHGQFDRLDKGVIEAAVKAGMSQKDVFDVVADFYYQDLDDKGAEDALRKAIAAKGDKPAEPTTEKGADNKPQLVIPGAEKIGDGKLAQMKSDAPLKPKAEQKDPGGLFSDAKDEMDMFADAPKPAPATESRDKNPALSEPAEEAPSVAAPAENAVVEAFRLHFASPVGTFRTILEARKFAIENGFKLQEGTPGNKQIEETIEHALVLAARDIIAASKKRGAETTYQRLVDLYNRQPRLGSRTSTSVAEQAYSTPIPLAFLASRLADITNGKSVFEPTAGNGALLIETAPSYVVANELNDIRRGNLEAQGYKVTGNDATDPRQANVLRQQGPIDVVIANPPFGAVRDGGESKVWKLGDFATTNIDHIISLTALQAMSPDGRAVLIIGGVKAESEAERSKGYTSSAKRKFFYRLMNEYNVTDIFTVDGGLYERQGAAWPVDVIVIEGKGKSARKPPSADVPRLFKSWDELKEKLDGHGFGEAVARPAGMAGESSRPAGGASGAGGRPGSNNGRPGTAADAGGAVAGETGAAEPPRVGERPAGGQPGDLLGEPRPGTGAQQNELDGVRDGGIAGAGVDPDGNGNLDLNELFEDIYAEEFGEPTAGPDRPAPNRRTEPEPDNWTSIGTIYGEDGSDLDVRMEKQIDEDRGVRSEILRITLYHGNTGSDLATWEWRRVGAKMFDDLSIDVPVFKYTMSDAADEAFGGIEYTDGDALWAVYGPEIRQMMMDAEGATPPRDITPNPPQIEGPRTIGGSIRSAAQNTVLGADDMLTGLNALFNSPGRLGSGPVFDPETYAKAKPFFQAAIAHFGKAGSDIADVMRALIRELKAKMKWGAEQIRAAQPYIVRFMEEWRSGQRQTMPPVQTNAQPNPTNTEENTTGQRPYQARTSTGQRLGTLVPTNLWTVINDALARVEANHGPIDQYVARELGYEMDAEGMYFMGEIDGKPAKIRPFSAEQIDSIGLAMDNIEKNTGFIIGDQTGIGKGRVVAAAIRYAHKKGMVPLFVTEKPDLYGDMWRDLHDIGFDKYLGRPIEMFMTNAGTRVPMDEEAVMWSAERDAAKDTGEKIPERRGVFSPPQDTKKASAKMRDILRGAYKPDVVFTTYDQMNSWRSQETDRRQFLRQIAPRSFLILDETHNAGGQGAAATDRMARGVAPPRSVVFREAVDSAQAILYSSATYAKSPKVMDLFARTDMSFAVEDKDQLAELIEAGGVPLQQAVSSMLARSGQYIRRERSFEGISYDVETAPVEIESYRQFSESLRSIFRFDLAFEDDRADIAQRIAAELGAGTARDGGTGDAGARTTAFASVMHNAVNQMVLSIKARAAGQRAVQALRDGEKPVVALSSTMESFITDAAEAAGIKSGEPITLDFGDVLRRYLERTRRVTITMPDDTKRHVMIKFNQMPANLVDRYRDVEAFLAGLDFSHMPISPIDYIRNEIKKAGYSVKEITGRDTMIDYSGNAPVYGARPKNEQGTTGKRVSIKEFNDGKLDALILNRSGSTGVSLHAKDTYKDRRKRRMILVQANPNIDTHMQMLGRVNRTGQVVLPAYTQLMADIPAEARPAAVLLKKMASLNANTTASRKGALSGDNVDFINEYGDRVVAEILDADMNLNMELNWPYDGTESIPGLAAKATGKLALLSVEEQQQFLDDVTERYTAMIERLDAIGENKLEAKSLDLRAITEEVTTLKESEGDSPFQEAVSLEKVSVKAQGRAMSPDEVLNMTKEALGLPEIPSRYGADSGFNRLAAIADKGREKLRDLITRTREEHNDHKRSILSGLKPDTRAKADEREEANFNRWASIARMASIGAVIEYEMGSSGDVAVVVGLSRSAKAKSPLALSAWQLTLAVPNSARTIGIPLSQVYTSQFPKPDDKEGMTISALVSPPTYTALGERFEEARREGRETRYIVTGNILAGWEQMDASGQITNYTTEDGATRQGILLPRGFNQGEFLADRGVKLKTGEQVFAYIDRTQEIINSVDTLLTVGPSPVMNRGYGYTILTPSAKSRGGKYFADMSVRNVFDRWEKQATMMVANVGTRAEAIRLVDALIGVGARFSVTGNMDVALEITGEKAPETKAASSNNNPADILKRINNMPTGRGRAMAAPRPKLTQKAQDAGIDEAHMTRIVTDIVRKVAGPGVGVEMVRGRIMVINGLDAAGGWYATEGIVRVAMDSLHKREVAYHEAFHALQSFGAFTPQEIAVMEREAPRHRAIVNAHWIRKTGAPVPVDLPVGESSAYAFGIYAEASEQNTPLTHLHIGVRRAFEKAMAILRRIRNYFTGLGFQTSEDIFARAAAGEYSDMRNPRRSWDNPDQAARLWNEGDGARAMASVPRREQTDRNIVSRGVENIADRFVRVRELQNQFRRDSGLTTVPDVHRALGSMDTRIAARIEDVVSDELNPLLTLIEEAGGEQQVHRYLYVRHAEERNDYIAQFNPAMPDGGSGIDTATARAELAAFQASPDFAALDAAAQAIDAMIQRDLDVRLAAGLYSQQQVNDLRNLFQHYVPLRGFESDEFQKGSPLAGVGISVARRESPIVRGRKSLADSIIAHTVLMRADGITRAEKNRVDVMLFRLAQMMEAHYGPASPMKAVTRPPMVQGGGSGSPVYSYVDPAYDMRPDVLTGKIGGKPRYVELAGEPRLAEQLKNQMLTNDDVGVLWIGALTRAMGRMWTVYNPFFAIKNTARDFLDASVAATALIGKGGTRAYMARIPRGALEATRAVFGAPSADFERFRLAGGRMSWAKIRNLEEIEQTISDRLDGWKLTNAHRKALQPIATVLEGWNDIFENAHRFALYKAAIDKGLPEAQAVKAALEGTMNFNRRGSGATVRVLRIIYPFMNPSIQAPLRAARLVQEAGGLGTAQGKKQAAKALVRGLTKTYFAFTIAGFALGMMNYAVGGDDDDEIPFWDKAQWNPQSRKNMIIYTGGKDDQGRPNAIMIPAFPEIMLPFHIGNALAASIWGKQSAADVAKQIGLSLAQMSPTEGRGATPAIFAPILENIYNRNHFGGMIHPDDGPQTRGVPEPERKFSTTDPRWQEFARVMAKSNIPFLTLHPEEWRHLARSYIGGWYQIAEAIAAGTGVSPDDKVNLLARPFFMPGSRSVDSFEREMFKEGEGKANAERASIKAKFNDPSAITATDRANNAREKEDQIRAAGGTVGPRGGVSAPVTEVFDTGRLVIGMIAKQRDAALVKALPEARPKIVSEYTNRMIAERKRFRRMADDLKAGRVDYESIRDRLSDIKRDARDALRQ